MFTFIDQLGNKLSLTDYPKRIVSLVPSQTELLHFLGLENEVVGITKFCVHPNEWFIKKKRIGGTKTVNIQQLKLLQPDLIIANKEENTKEQIEQLQQIAPVWVSDINTLDDALRMIREIGEITNRAKEAQLLAEEIQSRFHGLPVPTKLVRVAYLIWKDPYMAAGGNTFINHLLGRCGLQNVFADQLRYPQVSVNQLSSPNCGCIFLSSEPYPFKQKQVDELTLQIPGTKIKLVNGEMFSWYGSRLLLAAEYFEKLIQSMEKN